MADIVSKWNNGQVPSRGEATRGVPWCSFLWNKPDTSSHAPLYTYYHNYLGKNWTYVINADTATFASDMVITLYGSNNLENECPAKWQSIGTTSILTAGFSEKTVSFDYNEDMSKVTGGGATPLRSPGRNRPRTRTATEHDVP